MNYMCINFYSEIFIFDIKIDQNKFYHFYPVTKIAGHGQEGTFELGCHQVHEKYTRSSLKFNSYHMW